MVSNSLNTADSHHQPTRAEISHSRCTLILLLGCFLLPVALAYLALTTGWYKSQGLSNRGELVNPPLQITEVFPSLTASTRWQWVYPLPDVCDSSCENRLIQLRQALVAIGPERDRVGVLLVGEGPTDQKINEWLKTTSSNESKISVYTLAAEPFVDGVNRLQRASENLGKDYLYLMDPQGRIVLGYPPASDPTAWIQAGKSLLKDLKHLLKVSRIG